MGPQVSWIALLAGNRLARFPDRASERFSVFEWLISIVTKKWKII
jgi:hypothetical protein